MFQSLQFQLCHSDPAKNTTTVVNPTDQNFQSKLCNLIQNLYNKLT